MSVVPQKQKSTILADILSRNQERLLAAWIGEMNGATRRSDLLKESELRSQCSQFLSLVSRAVEADGSSFQSAAWDPVREFLSEVSRSRAQQGFTPSETATFVFSRKTPDLRPDSRRIPRRCGWAGRGTVDGD